MRFYTTLSPTVLCVCVLLPHVRRRRARTLAKRHRAPHTPSLSHRPSPLTAEAHHGPDPTDTPSDASECGLLNDVPPSVHVWLQVVVENGWRSPLVLSAIPAADGIAPPQQRSVQEASARSEAMWRGGRYRWFGGALGSHGESGRGRAARGRRIPALPLEGVAPEPPPSPTRLLPSRRTADPWWVRQNKGWGGGGGTHDPCVCGPGCDAGAL